MSKRVSRRNLLKRGVAAAGSLALGTSELMAGDRPKYVTKAWVLKPDGDQIAGRRGTIERSLGSRISLCTWGREFQGRTCDGPKLQFLVPLNDPLPEVGTTYRFELTGKDNSCGEVLAKLFVANQCDTDAGGDSDGAESDTTTEPETTSDSSSDTTTEETTTTTEETPTEPTTDETTTETTTEETTTTTEKTTTEEPPTTEETTTTTEETPTEPTTAEFRESFDAATEPSDDVTSS